MSSRSNLVVGVVSHGGHLHGERPSYVSLECTQTPLAPPLGGAIAINKHVDSQVSERKGDQTRVTLEPNAKNDVLNVWRGYDLTPNQGRQMQQHDLHIHFPDSLYDRTNVAW